MACSVKYTLPMLPRVYINEKIVFKKVILCHSKLPMYPVSGTYLSYRPAREPIYRTGPPYLPYCPREKWIHKSHVDIFNHAYFLNKNFIFNPNMLQIIILLK